MVALPLIPLSPPLVLLPGTTLRIPLLNRADIAAILANVYARSASPGNGSTSIGCVPINSPLLGPDGQKLITDGKKSKHSRNQDVDVNDIKRKDLYNYGCVAKVTGVQGRREGELSLVVEGLARFKVGRVLKERPFLEAECVPIEDEGPSKVNSTNLELFNELKERTREFPALVRLSSNLPRSRSLSMSPMLARRVELYVHRKEVQDADTLSDFIANLIDCSHEEKLKILAALSTKDRLIRVTEAMERQIRLLQGNGRLVSITSSDSQGLDVEKLKKLQQDLLRGRGRNINLPPGFMAGLPNGGNGNQEGASELDELKKRLEDAKLPPDANKVAQRELTRLTQMNPSQAEYQVCRNYLETLAEIPWSKVTEDKLDAATLSRARKQLEDDHYGLEKIKKRLLEYLAVLKLKQAVNADIEAQIQKISENFENTNVDEAKAEDEEREEEAKKPEPRQQSEQELRLLERKRMVDKSPILLLVGPPGTGKTSLAKSVATALGRKFHRISLGGVRDEAEIRGHRRTYVAAMPGLIVNGLKKVGVANPVFLLDEIDKLGMSNFHGDPSAAMLEVLDPEQNHTFTDHYVNTPIDLSKVLFIATANSLETIPAPLLDRMETIQLSGYTTLEKRHIAMQHLLPKQITTNGLTPPLISLDSEVLDKIITGYTRESGVRNLERELGSVCRYKAVEYADSKDSTSSTTTPYNPVVTITDLDAILGIERFEEEIASTTARPGVVTGLVAYSTGGQGSILFIEVADMPGSGRVQLTGKLGDVLKESVEVALSWVKAHAWELGLTTGPDEDIMKSRSVHVHCPAGAIPKDGPSAGLAHTVALISLFSGKPVPPHIAMTGEMSLRGRVMPVGGIKEKLIGALRAGVRTVLLPEGNRKDARELPTEVQEGLQITFVAGIWEALREIWPTGGYVGERVDSRL